MELPNSSRDRSYVVACAPHVRHFIVHTRRAGHVIVRPLMRSSLSSRVQSLHSRANAPISRGLTCGRVSREVAWTKGGHQ
jgi:hypothetical protein